MSPDIRETLFLEVHRIIASESTQTADALGTDITEEMVTYPPKPVLTDREVDALRDLQLTSDARTGLQKVIASSCASVFFQFFSLLDGVADPELREIGTWLGARIVEPPDDSDEPMWHDDFFESYWDYERLATDA